MENSTLLEKSFFEQIRPLLEGAELYLKFSLNQPAFDPLDALKRPPDTCGYGIRHFRLHKALSRIDVRQPLKTGFDSSIAIDQILAPMIPQSTMAVLKLQNKLLNTDLGLVNKNLDERVFEDIREWSIFDANHQILQRKARDCVFYSFSVALEQGGRVELVVRGYTVFKQWINGINLLVKYKRTLPKLKDRIES